MRCMYHKGEGKYPEKENAFHLQGCLSFTDSLNFIADIKCHFLKENFPADFSTFLQHHFEGSRMGIIIPNFQIQRYEMRAMNKFSWW